MNFLLCLQVFEISLLELRLASSFIYRIIYFSFRHNIHLPIAGLYTGACPNMYQVMVGSIPLSYNSHMYLLSAVLFLLDLYLKLFLCCVYLTLNSPPVIPTYDSSISGSPLPTTAWYTNDSVLHIPCSGHSSGFLQLQAQVAVSCDSSVLGLSTFLLCFPMICFTLGIQR